MNKKQLAIDAAMPMGSGTASRILKTKNVTRTAIPEQSRVIPIFLYPRERMTKGDLLRLRLRRFGPLHPAEDTGDRLRHRHRLRRLPHVPKRS